MSDPKKFFEVSHWKFPSFAKKKWQMKNKNKKTKLIAIAKTTRFHGNHVSQLTTVKILSTKSIFYYYQWFRIWNQDQETFKILVFWNQKKKDEDVKSVSESWNPRHKPRGWTNISRFQDVKLLFSWNKFQEPLRGAWKFQDILTIWRVSCGNRSWWGIFL